MNLRNWGGKGDFLGNLVVQSDLRRDTGILRKG